MLARSDRLIARLEQNRTASPSASLDGLRRARCSSMPDLGAGALGSRLPPSKGRPTRRLEAKAAKPSNKQSPPACKAEFDEKAVPRLNEAREELLERAMPVIARDAPAVEDADDVGSPPWQCKSLMGAQCWHG